MPNGGIPIHMALFPSDGSDFVLYCHAGSLNIFSRKEWDENKAKGKPLATLSEAEGAAVAGFLKYWVGDDRLSPCRPEKGVNALYDF